MTILLCGFSGAGKTFLLRRIEANQADENWCFFDLDEEIERAQQQTISQIVKKHGLDYFRKLETNKLEKLLQNHKSKCVLALGGGALENNYDWIKDLKYLKMVWLDVPFLKCYERISKDLGRPLIALGKNELEALYTKRVLTYERADLRLYGDQIDNIKKLKDLLELIK